MGRFTEMLGLGATFDDFAQKGMSLGNRKCSFFRRLHVCENNRNMCFFPKFVES